MIFVTLGTWEMPFVRPLIELEKALAEGVLNEPVIVQNGKTPYQSERMTLVPFFDKADMEQMYDNATLVICQAGVGSIMLGLRKRKTVIAIARRRIFDEHIDDHQLEILGVFAKAGTILPWDGAGDLPDILRRAKAFVPAEYPFAEERISGAILDYLENTICFRD